MQTRGGGWPLGQESYHIRVRATGGWGVGVQGFPPSAWSASLRFPGNEKPASQVASECHFNPWGQHLQGLVVLL